MRQIFITAVALFATVIPGISFAEPKEEPPPYIIASFDILGWVSVMQADSGENQAQYEVRRKQLSWVLDESRQLTTSIYSSSGDKVTTSETSKPLDMIEQDSFEVKQSARTDQMSAESFALARMTVDHTGILIEGHPNVS